MTEPFVHQYYNYVENEQPRPDQDICKQLDKTSPSTTDVEPPAKQAQRNQNNVQKLLHFVINDFEDTCLHFFSSISRNTALHAAKADGLSSSVAEIMIATVQLLSTNSDVEKLRHFSMNHGHESSSIEHPIDTIDTHCHAALDALTQTTAYARNEMEMELATSATYIPVVLKRDMNMHDNQKHQERHARFKKLFAWAIDAVTRTDDMTLNFQVIQERNSLHLLVEHVQKVKESLLALAEAEEQHGGHGHLFNVLLRIFFDQIRYIGVGFIRFINLK